MKIDKYKFVSVYVFRAAIVLGLITAAIGAITAITQNDIAKLIWVVLYTIVLILSAIHIFCSSSWDDGHMASHNKRFVIPLKILLMCLFAINFINNIGLVTVMLICIWMEVFSFYIL